MELVALSPDVILASTTTALAALQPVTRTVPIVFAQVADPVSAGFVANMAQPGANIDRVSGILEKWWRLAVSWPMGEFWRLV